jgi:NAD(P)-dependent dehydrogenase (short-subunit alcohol dehydrogenase family)
MSTQAPGKDAGDRRARQQRRLFDQASAGARARLGFHDRDVLAEYVRPDEAVLAFHAAAQGSKNDPNIINITSIGIRRGAPTASIYGAAKGAVDAFTRAIAELAPAIRVNAVSPGVIITPFHDKVSTPQLFENWKNATPLKRNGEPRDVARAIQFLMDCSFLCGETVDVNGGQYMR